MIQGFVSPEALALMFLFFGLAIAVVIKNIRNAYPFVPYAPTLFIISIGLGYSCSHTGIIGQSIKQISSIDPRGILLIFLPPLIFQSSFNSDWYIFRKQSVQIFILAFPAVLVSALFIMFSIKVIIAYDQSYYNWSQAFMFGSVLSCTDTVAVLALLKEAGAPRKFNSLIEGESLFNDGTCMVLFTISLQLVKGSAPPPLKIGQLFLQLTIGAIILGSLFGFLSAKLINFVRNDTILTLNITVVSCYILYFVAQYVDLGIKISGIMSLVSMGLYMAAFGKTKIPPDANQIIENFWKIYIFVAQTIIFILGGVLVGVQATRPEFLDMMDSGNLQKLLYLYLCMTMARFFSIAIFMPKLQYQGYGLKWKQVGALTYGGLRGAVGIAFTLILASNPMLNPKFKMVSLLNTSGCAFLTLVINAPTCSYVIKKLGLCVKSDTKIRFFRKFMKECECEMNKQFQNMRKNEHLFSSDWQKVKQQSGMVELHTFITQTSQNLKGRSHSTKEKERSNSLTQSLLDPSLQDFHFMRGLQQQIDPSLMQQIRNRFCVALKGILWQKFSDNQCSSESIRVLIQCVNIDMDTIGQPLNSWDYLISHLHNPYFFPICFWLKNKPIIGPIAFSWMYQRIKLLYDVISTYLDALTDCESACRNLPYDQYLQAKVIEQSSQNRKLAQSFLDHQIKISYFEIMKRIQTTKAAQSILTFQKQFINEAFQYGQINDSFYKQILQIVHDRSMKLESDSQAKQTMKDIDILKQSQFFRQLSDIQLRQILLNKEDLLVQKDQPVLKSYQRQKFIYLVARGEIVEQYKTEGQTVYRRNVSLYHLSGVGVLLINRKQLQYCATALSIVSLFCFPINDIKKVMAKKQKLQQIVQNDIFMLEIRIQPQIMKSIDISQSQWKRRRNLITFKRLNKGQTFTVQHSYLVLIFGKLMIGQTMHIQGCFKIKDMATIQGPSKLYFCSLAMLQQQQLSKSEYNAIRSSYSRQNRLSNSSHKDSSIIRRTLYNKD